MSPLGRTRTGKDDGMNVPGVTAFMKGGVKAAGLLLVAASVLAGCAVLPKDDVNLTLLRFDGVRGQRYTDIFLIGGNSFTKELVGSAYTTIGLNNLTGSGDSSPQELLDRFALTELKKGYDLLSVYRNGPRFWTLDWVEIGLGAERDFNGLKARWYMWVDLPGDFILTESIAYRVVQARRDMRLGISTGSLAFMLDDPEGNTWVMRSASLVRNPRQTAESLKNLGSSLKLPPGWTFRAMTLDRELILTPDDGVVSITQDDLGNTYDRAGGPSSNYKP